jgi:4-amino-4-deoxy-L-arabinose transferase-like glycosyltransferase
MNQPNPRSLFDWVRQLWGTFLFPGRQTLPTAVRRTSLAILIALPAMLLYPTLDFHLLEPDEGRYAQIPREMITTGDWVVPHLQGKPYLDKPPLLYWLIALSYTLFGVSEESARLIPALAIHATILAVYLLGRRSLGERTAFWGALLLAIAPGFLGMGRLLILDGLLTLFVTLAIFCTYEAIRNPAFDRRWWYIAALAAGLGVLTKGPISLLLLAPPVWVYRRLCAERCEIRKRDIAGFLAVVAAINIPWYVGIFLREPVFLRYFFWEHNVMRFIKPFDHLQPFWYYLPILLGGLMPGTVMLYGFAKHIASGEPMQSRTPALGFFLLCGLFCVAFFSASGCKLPTYILPAFPCLLLAFGDYIARTKWNTARLPKVGVAAMTALLVFTNYFALPWYAERRSPMGIPEVAERLHEARDEVMFAFPRNVDSVAFYTDRSDLKNVRTKASQELVEAIIKEKRAVVLFTHRHSLETFKQVLPPFLKVTETIPARHRTTGAKLLDQLSGDSPWGLCDVAVVEVVR